MSNFNTVIDNSATSTVPTETMIVHVASVAFVTAAYTVMFTWILVFNILIIGDWPLTGLLPIFLRVGATALTVIFVNLICVPLGLLVGYIIRRQYRKYWLANV